MVPRNNSADANENTDENTQTANPHKDANTDKDANEYAAAIDPDQYSHQHTTTGYAYQHVHTANPDEYADGNLTAFTHKQHDADWG